MLVTAKVVKVRDSFQDMESKVVCSFVLLRREGSRPKYPTVLMLGLDNLIASLLLMFLKKTSKNAKKSLSAGTSLLGVLLAMLSASVGSIHCLCGCSGQTIMRTFLLNSGAVQGLLSDCGNIRRFLWTHILA